MKSCTRPNDLRFLGGLVAACVFLALTGSIEAGGGHTLTAAPIQVTVGQTIQVCWTAPAGGVASNDWIGMFVAGAPNTQYLGFQVNSTASTSGCFNFTAPVHVGYLEFRYLPLNLYTSVATSNAVNVLCAADAHCSDSVACTIDKCIQGACSNTTTATAMIALTATPTALTLHGVISVCWNTPAHLASNTDWIAQFKVGTGNFSYVSYQYTGGAATGCLPFAAGPNEGDYEFRFFPQNGNCAFATSQTVTFCDATLSPTCPCAATAECNDEDICTVDQCTAESVQQHRSRSAALHDYVLPARNQQRCADYGLLDGADGVFSD